MSREVNVSSWHVSLSRETAMKNVLWIFGICVLLKFIPNNILYAGVFSDVKPFVSYWVSPSGSDSNPCTELAPCRTIGFVLAQKAGDGDVVMVQPGIYREQLDITHSDLTLQGVGDGVYILGSIVPDLELSSGLYRVDWSWGVSFEGTTFCNNLTNDVTLGSESCNTLGFWQDGIRLDQVFTQGNVTSGTFYYDFDAEEVWLEPVAGNSDLSLIEGLAHEYVVRLTEESRRVTLKNLNIWYGASKPDDGILRVEGAGHVLEDIHVRYSAGAGVEVLGADQASMINVRASDHGQNGWRVQADASFSTSTGWTINDWVDDLLVSNSSSEYNGWKGYDNCWGGGGTKFSFTQNLTVDAFYSADNNGFGIWLDIENHGYSVTQSMSARDAGRGLFVEYISDDGVVDNNVVFATKDADDIGCGISVGLAAADSRNVVLSNNTVYTMDNDVKGIMLKTGCPTCRSFPYPSENITWENNLIVNKDAAGFVRDLDAGSTETFTYIGTTVEEEFAGDGSTFTCWDNLGDCTQASLGIEEIPPGVYLEDELSECGFTATSATISGKGAQSFLHPRAVEVCGSEPPPPDPQPPVASFTFTTSFLEVTFTDTSSDDGSIVSWAWDFGDGNTSTAQNPVHTYVTASTFTTTLTVTDDEGLSDTASQNVTVENAPPDPVPPVASFTVSTSFLEAAFTDTSIDDGSIVAWSWDFGDGNSSTEQNPTHTYAGAGTYTTTLTVTDDEGLTDTASQSVAVEEEVIGDGAFIEIDGLVVFEAENYTESQPNTTTGDEWTLLSVDFDGTTVTTMQALEDNGDLIRAGFQVDNATMVYPISITNTGTYYVWARLWALAGGTSAYLGIEDEGDPVGVIAPTAPSSEWTWVGTKNAGQSARIQIDTPGEHAFNIWMREDGLYIDRILLTTDVNYVPTGIGPAESPREQAGAAQADGIGRDILEFETRTQLPKVFRVDNPYPNPSNLRATWRLDLPEPTHLKVILFDMLGREMSGSEATFPAGTNQPISLDVSGLPGGVYIYRVEAYSGGVTKVEVGRLVVVR